MARSEGLEERLEHLSILLDRLERLDQFDFDDPELVSAHAELVATIDFFLAKLKRAEAPG